MIHKLFSNIQVVGVIPVPVTVHTVQPERWIRSSGFRVVHPDDYNCAYSGTRFRSRASLRRIKPCHLGSVRVAELLIRASRYAYTFCEPRDCLYAHGFHVYLHPPPMGSFRPSLRTYWFTTSVIDQNEYFRPLRIESHPIFETDLHRVPPCLSVAHLVS